MIGPANPSGASWLGGRTRILALAAAWFWLMLLPSRLPTPTLEPSWETVLNFAAVHRLQHGVDIVFTYGPLGYLMQNCFYPGTWLPGLLFQALSRALYVVLVWRLAQCAAGRENGGRAAALAFLAAALWLPALDADSFYLLFITMVGGLIAGERLADRERVVSLSPLECLGIFSAGILALIKTTFLGFGLLMLAAVMVAAIGQGRRRAALAAPLVFAMAFCFGWGVLGHQHFANLRLWMRGSSEMARGYPQAMGVWPDPNQLVSGGLALLVVGAALVAVVWRTWKSLPLALVLAAGCCLAWKQSFTRGDEYHTRTFFVYILTAGSLLPVLFTLALNRVAGIFLLGLCLGSSLLYRLPVPLYRAFENARFLVRLPHRDQFWARQAQAYDLPQLRAIVGASSVDVAGAEQAIALLNGFNYQPAPVFQPYAASTPYLARLNAEYYRSDRAPEFVITRGYTIDNRLPNLDDSLTGLILAQRYRLVATENGFRLLHRVAASDGAWETVATGEVAAGEPIKVSGGQWCEIVMEESLLGRLTRWCWMSPPVYAELGRSDGTSASYRFVPSMARTGFVVAEGITTGAVSKSPAQRLCFRPVIRYRVCKVPTVLVSPHQL